MRLGQLCLNLILIKSFTFAEKSKRAFDPIVLKSRYVKSDGLIKWNFPLFYGVAGENLNHMLVRLDFNYEGIIFLSQEISDIGIICSEDFGCSFNNRLIIVPSPNQRQQIGVHDAKMTLMFSPFIDDPDYQPSELDFYYNNSDPNFISDNVIGLDLKSVFWHYLFRFFNRDIIIILFETSIGKHTSKDLIEDVSLIDTSMTLFPIFQMSNYYQLSSNELFLFPHTLIRFGSLIDFFECTFSFEQTYLLKVSSIIYTHLLKTIHSIICIDPNRCVTDTDMYGNYDTLEKLSIEFENSDQSNSSDSLKINLEIQELFYLDKKGVIGYNIASFGSQEDVVNIVILGLPFLGKYSFLIVFKENQSQFDFFLIPKEKKELDGLLFNFFVFTIVISFLLAVYLKMKTTPKNEIEIFDFTEHSMATSIQI
jgi:hypothetical protein